MSERWSSGGVVSVGVRVSGLNEVMRDLMRVGVAAKDLRSAMYQVAIVGRETARRYAPKRSGKLASSISASAARSRATIRTKSPYAQFVHYGSIHNPRPVPFMQFAANDLDPIVANVLERELSVLIAKYGF